MVNPGRTRRYPRGWGLCAMLAVACGTAPTAPSSPVPGRLGEWVRVGGVERTYVMHLPSTYDTSYSWPLLVVFHGNHDSGATFRNRIGLQPVADSAGVITVFPNGRFGGWAPGCDCTESDFIGVDDTVFVKALLDHLTDSLAVDPARIYVAGFSQGGMMVERLVCTLSDRLAGGISVGATLPETIADDCMPSQPVPVIFFLGTADPEFGAQNTSGDVHFFSSAQTVAFFAREAGCSPNPVETTQPAEPGVESVRVTQYPRCSRSQVRLYTIEGGGHTWPDSPGPWPAEYGPVSRAINANIEILRFIGAL